MKDFKTQERLKNTYCDTFQAHILNVNGLLKGLPRLDHFSKPREFSDNHSAAGFRQAQRVR